MSFKVAVIGGGPAGAVCSLYLARAGVDVFLFERDSHREKPCGGGLTLRALAVLPDEKTLQIEAADITRFRLISPGGRRIDLDLADDPIRIVSRWRLDHALRRLALSHGAAVIEETVRKPTPMPGGGWRINGRLVDVVVGAGGIHDPVARLFGRSKPGRRRKGRTFGFFVPGRFSGRIVCRFFPGLHGYAWWFPRSDHASLGIECFRGQFDIAKARVLLNRFVRRDLDISDRVRRSIASGRARPFAWAEPIPTSKMLKKRTVHGPDWLLTGDAAGLVDGVTGEGIPYALLSGRLAAEAILAGRLADYSASLKTKIQPELIAAARMSPLFYQSIILRGTFFMLGHSRTMQRMARDMAVGRQRYAHGIRRMFADAPAILRETTRSLIHRTREKGDLHAS